MPKGEKAIKISSYDDLLTRLGAKDVKIESDELSKIEGKDFYVTRKELVDLKTEIGKKGAEGDSKKELIKNFVDYKLQILEGKNNVNLKSEIELLVNKQNEMIGDINPKGNIESQREKLEVLDDGLGVLVVALKYLSGTDINLTNPQHFFEVYRQYKSQLHPSLLIVGNKYEEIMSKGNQELRRHLNGTVLAAYKGTPSNYDGSRWGFVKRQYEDNPGYAWTLTLLGSIGLFMGVKKAFFGKKEGSSGGGSGNGGKSSFLKKAIGSGLSIAALLGIGSLVARNDTVRQKIKEITGYDMDKGAFGKFITHPIDSIFNFLDKDRDKKTEMSDQWHEGVSKMINDQNLTIKAEQALFSTRTWEWALKWKFIQAGELKPCTITKELLKKYGPREASYFMRDYWIRDAWRTGESILGVGEVYQKVYLTQYLKMRTNLEVQHYNEKDGKIQLKGLTGSFDLPETFKKNCKLGGKLIPSNGSVENVLDRIRVFQENNPKFNPTFGVKENLQPQEQVPQPKGDNPHEGFKQHNVEINPGEHKVVASYEILKSETLNGHSIDRKEKYFVIIRRYNDSYLIHHVKGDDQNNLKIPDALGKELDNFSILGFNGLKILIEKEIENENKNKSLDKNSIKILFDKK